MYVLFREIRETLRSKTVFDYNAIILPFFHHNALFYHSKINIKAIFQYTTRNNGKLNLTKNCTDRLTSPFQSIHY